MLVLSRKLGGRINVYVPGSPHPIELVICSIESDRVRVGIEAPRDVQIYRSEIDPRTAAIVGG
jgi:carbon storage regulator CsrA